MVLDLQVGHITQHMETSEHALQERIQRLEAIRIRLEEVSGMASQYCELFPENQLNLVLSCFGFSLRICIQIQTTAGFLVCFYDQKLQCVVLLPCH